VLHRLSRRCETIFLVHFDLGGRMWFSIGSFICLSLCSRTLPLQTSEPCQSPQIKDLSRILMKRKGFAGCFIGILIMKSMR